jgi:hypothetical protein
MFYVVIISYCVNYVFLFIFVFVSSLSYINGLLTLVFVCTLTFVSILYLSLK